MKRLIVMAALAIGLVIGLAPSRTSETLAGTTPRLQAQGAGRGQCLIVSSDEFFCKFRGQLRGKLDGVRRMGTWTLQFKAAFTRPGASTAALVTNEQVKEVRFTFVVAPKGDLPRLVIKSPRDSASGQATGIVTDNVDPDELFSLTLSSPTVGSVGMLTAEATISPGMPLQSVFHNITWT